MDLFKSVFSADPDPDPDPDPAVSSPTSSSLPPDSAGGVTDRWGSFRGLVKTFASKSESVIQTYRRDLEEFGSGLKKETTTIREVAARAVRELPASLEAGASKAHESLESVGHAIEDIISHGKDAILSLDEDSADTSPNDHNSASSDVPGTASRGYSRFGAQLLAIQSDARTFSEAPQDGADFSRWRSEFELAEKEDEIESLCYENNALDELLEKMVPAVVDYETFWCRYYYRVHKLRQAEDARAKLVQRAISTEEEEDLSWEVDDVEEPDGETKEEKKEEILEQATEPKAITEENNIIEGVQVMSTDDLTEKQDSESLPVESSEAPAAPKVEEQLPSATGKAAIAAEVSSGKELTYNLDATVAPEEVKTEASVISSQQCVSVEDDLEWDEIENLGEHDARKACTSSGSPLKLDIRKSLSAAEEDEDLSWDIEDDDEHAKP